MSNEVEILFRAWDGKKFHYYTLLDLVTLNSKDVENGQFRFGFQQWIGLNDMKGKKIYDGDILAPSEEDIKFEVVYGETDDDTFGWGLKGSYDGHIFTVESESIKELNVIGNKYQKSELMK